VLLWLVEMDATANIRKVASMRQQSSGSIWRRGDEMFSRSRREDEDEEELLRWAALEKLPTYDRIRRAVLPFLDGDEDEPLAAAKKGVVDVHGLCPRERRALIDRLVRVADEDNERFLLKLKDRLERCVRRAVVRRRSEERLDRCGVG
jgi:hypothetical protein